jgi:amino-acid N-acetyltransferase
MDGWGACVTGALERQDYLDRLIRAGFTAVGCDTTREYDVASLVGWEHWPVDVTLVSAFVHARRPDCGDPVLRPATAEDLPAALRLLTEAALPTDGLNAQFPGQYVVADVDGRPIAVAGIERYGDVGLLRSVALDELWRGHRLGTSLVEERLAFAKKTGLTDVYLLTTTAAPFFAKLGFSALERGTAPVELRSAPEFSSICPLSSSFMRLHFD